MLALIMLQLHRNKNDYVLCLYDTDKKVGRSSATDSNIELISQYLSEYILYAHVVYMEMMIFYQ